MLPLSPPESERCANVAKHSSLPPLLADAAAALSFLVPLLPGSVCLLISTAICLLIELPGDP